MKFNEKLPKLRKEKGFSQEKLADILNVSRQAVSKWESGLSYPETEKIIEISKLFNVSIDNLLKDEKISKKPELEFNPQEEKDYLGFMRKFAFAISIGVDLCILTAFLLLINIPIYIAIIPILPSVILFVYNGMELTNYDNFRLKYLQFKTINRKEQEKFRKKFNIAITLGVAILIIGLIFFLFDYKVEYLLIAAFIAVPLFVYFGILSGNYQLEMNYRQENKNQAFIGKTSGTIMLGATIIFLISGFIYSAWHPMWLVYPISGMLCGIVDTIFSDDRYY